jgi:hypothetical protein
MDLPDVETLRSGEPWSWTWYDEVFVPVFRSRKCDRCGETKETLGAFIGGTTKYCTYLLFGYPAEIVEKMLIALRLNTWCLPCFNKLHFNGSGVPPTASQIRSSWKKEK